MTPVASRISLAGDAASLIVVGALALLSGYFVAVQPGGAIAVAGLIAAAVCPRWWLLVAAIAWALVLPVYDIGYGIQLSDPLLGLYVVRTALISGSWREPLSQSPYLWLGLFFGWAWLSVGVVGSQETAPALARVTLYGLVCLMAARDHGLARPLLRTIAAMAAIEVLYGVTQLSGVGDRLVGTRDDPHELGILLLAGLAALPALPKQWRIPIGTVVVVGLGLSFTRAVWAAGVVELALLTLPGIRGGKRPVAVAVAVVALAVALVPAITEQFNLNPESIEQRQQSIHSGFDEVREAPLFGLGWALGGGQASGEVVPYNMWVNIAASTGVVGALLFTLFLATSFVRFAGVRARREARSVGIFVLGFCVLALASMPIYAAGSGAILFFVLTGAGLGSVRAGELSGLRTDGSTLRPALAATGRRT